MAPLILPEVGILGRAAAELERDAENASERHAIHKALWYLSGHLEIRPVFGGFLIPSGSRSGLIHKVSTVHGCSCEAALKCRPCWHLWAISIIERAQQHTMPALTSAPLKGAHADRYSRALAEMDDLFPHR